MPHTVRFVLPLALVLLLCACGEPAGQDQAQTAPTTESGADAEATIRAALGKLGEVGDVRETEWPGVYSVMLDGQPVHTNAEGAYILVGDLYRVSDQANLTEARRSEQRLAALEAIDDRDTINFAPEGKTEHVVWVFTDVDCGYCQRLHSQMAQYNKLGIEVRYLAYPRAGKGSTAWQIAEQIWCADDRKAMLTQAKLHRDDFEVAPANCDTQAVARDHDLGGQLGLRGTPMIIDEQGRTVGGYVPPPALKQVLEEQG
jgi:thiol:disulfide interchange protein DsbC